MSADVRLHPPRARFAAASALLAAALGLPSAAGAAPKVTVDGSTVHGSVQLAVTADAFRAALKDPNFEDRVGGNGAKAACSVTYEASMAIKLAVPRSWVTSGLRRTVQRMLASMESWSEQSGGR